MQQVTSPTSPSDFSLPQYGFGAEVAFDALIDTNPFLFRVYTPKHSASASTSASDDSDAPYFLAQRFDNDPLAPISKPSLATYADVAHHMDWVTKSTSPFVSSSFSFAWALWEAVRRYHSNVKHDVEIAVIDARLVVGKAVTAIELLRKSQTKERHVDHWKWYRFALESQSVLIHHSIPHQAVYSSIPLLKLLEKLPSYLTTSETDKSIPFDGLSWDYTQKKQSFELFCKGTAERFLKMPVEKRLRDTTTSAVRLSLSFLRPWLHRVSLGDAGSAQTALTDLAIVVGRWPGQLWVRDHSEVAELCKAMVDIVLEEMRESQKTQKAADAEKMQVIVDQVRRLSLECEKEISRRRLLEAVTHSPVFSAPVDEKEAEKVETAIPPPYKLKKTDQQAFISRVTASTWFTGFIFGSFVTLCLLSHQRRELLYCT
ncbi:hypothetical protein BDM02DRAFT_3096758 [Thelephora ganbajun]|uniref:Uncharacterized protein n=1 Tax=Thelephora ganbajun TaxID=370292 RepID=A0ACB6ZFH1_THEGA|nr:hypothetical protein BDM02DRAFT_3096758 [Thelephora ganbajun]